MSEATLQQALEYPAKKEKLDIDYETLIIGSGLSGIGAGIRLIKEGCPDFIILEKADDLGGTWRDNTYPGLAVDVPSLSYSFSFEQNPNWSSLYASGVEMKNYVDHCAQKYGIRPHMRYNAEVEESSFDEEHNVWVTRTTAGDTYVSRFLVSATGFLTVPKLPIIDGIETFKGKVMHTGRWDHSYDMTGKRVGFIGTGATGIQAVPEIVDECKTLDIYQRTPIWLLPKKEMPFSERTQEIFATVPGAQWLARLVMMFFTDIVMINLLVYNKYFSFAGKKLQDLCIDHIRNQVDDPATQEALIPKYDFGCKRPSFTSKFYPVFNRDDTNLVTDPIERITENAIVTKDGTVREIDMLICATGFEVFQKGSVPTYCVKGKGDLDLSDFWENNRYQAYSGSTVPRFPNFFLMFGPYSVCTASWFGMIDTQSKHLVRCIKEAKKRNANYVEIKESANEKDFKKVVARTRSTIFKTGDCARSNSYYFDRHGDSPTIRPTMGFLHWFNTRFFSMKNYIIENR
ncbi:MAG: NAD(P)/FAD-dependent oxidoreductase [Pseudomonadales bacterium]|nr:NAD(P)/FAD-dependent oxidoreductase [Pseudomonadales bacterium]